MMIVLSEMACMHSLSALGARGRKPGLYMIQPYTFGPVGRYGWKCCPTIGCIGDLAAEWAFGSVFRLRFLNGSDALGID